MRFKRVALLCCALTVVAICSMVTIDSAAESTPPATPVTYAYTGPTTDPHAELARAIEMAVAQKAANDAHFYEEMARQDAERKAAAKKKSSSHSAPTTDYSSMEPCGGDLPPCWVKGRESGGNYGAYNPTGCAAVVHGVSGRGCYGAWQFGWFWAGKLGLPADLSTATPAQQDAAARALWNGGAGCSNWGAC